MYETKINIYTKGFKKRFSISFFVFFQKKNYKICKKLFFKNGYTYKFDNVLIDSLILSKSVSEYHSFISLHKEKTSQTVHLDFFFDCEKNIEFVKKKPRPQFCFNPLHNQSKWEHSYAGYADWLWKF